MLPEKILATTIAWCAAIVAIIFVVFLVKDICAYLKGNGASIGSILTKVLVVFALIGIMYAAGSFKIFGEMFKGVFESVVTEENLPDIGQR